MSSRRAALVALILIAVVGTVFVTRRTQDAASTAGAPQESSGSTAKPDPSADASGAHAPAPRSGVSGPTAEWIVAPANPLIVEAPVPSHGGTESSEVSAGGGIIELAANRRKFTLYIPPDAVLINTNLELTAIERAPGLPFADQNASAVQITNLPPALQKAAILTIEPEAEPASADPIGAAAYAIAPASRELQLQPYVRVDQEVSNSRQRLYKLLVTADGTYGVSKAAPDELRAIYARRPTASLARIEMMIAQHLLEAQGSLPPAASHRARRWSIIPAVLAQSEEDREHLSELALRVAQALRDVYEQELMPRVGSIGRGCTPEDRELLLVVNQEVVRWLKAAEMVGFIEADRDNEALPSDPRLYLREIERREYFRRIEEEFQNRAEALKRALRDGFERMFESVKECCRKAPERWMPPYLVSLQRNAAINAIGGTALNSNGLIDAQECSCAVDAILDGKGWTGTIRQTDRYSGEARTATSIFRETTVSTHLYSVEVTLLGGHEGGSAYGLAISSGEQKFTSERVDTDWACAVDESGSSREVTGARGTVLAPVGITMMSGGRYMINFPRPLAIGLEHHRQYRKREGCKNRFNDRTTNDYDIRSDEVSTDYQKTIHGQTDLSTELSGSVSVTTPDIHLKRNRQATVTWNVRACQAK